jgi:5'-deoxynucleotidase YfbR-like HD superfamily hydrolase
VTPRRFEHHAEESRRDQFVDLIPQSTDRGEIDVGCGHGEHGLGRPDLDGRPPRAAARRPYHASVLEPGPFIQTLSGRRVNPLEAAVEDIDPADIARALSNLCRFGGHSKAFYSVAQHSAIVCDLLDERGATPDELMAALLHDAAEAYLGDLPHPLKHRSELGAAFRVAEKRLEAVIGERFALPDATARIKPLDKALLATERRTFSEVTWHWPELEGAEELELEIEPWDSGRALREFTERYERIDALRRVPS